MGPAVIIPSRFRITIPGSCAASWSARDAAASAVPWPRSDGCARGWPRTPGAARTGRGGLLRHLEDLPPLVHRDFHLHRDLFRGGFPPELLHELPGRPDE